jgi:5-methylcytosine-specific restriction protein A
MPDALPCLCPWCCGVSVGPCPCRQTAWRGTSPNRIRGRELQRRRAKLFAREPLCRLCKAHGRVTAATIRDHIKPLAEGGTDADSNIQPLCLDCSDAKTAAESARGRKRMSG